MEAEGLPAGRNEKGFALQEQEKTPNRLLGPETMCPTEINSLQEVYKKPADTIILTVRHVVSRD